MTFALPPLALTTFPGFFFSFVSGGGAGAAQQEGLRAGRIGGEQQAALAPLAVGEEARSRHFAALPAGQGLARAAVGGDLEVGRGAALTAVAEIFTVARRC